MKTKTIRNHPERVLYDASYIFQHNARTASKFVTLRAKCWDDDVVRELEMARCLSFYKGSYPSESEMSKTLFTLLCQRLEQLSGIPVSEMASDATF